MQWNWQVSNLFGPRIRPWRRWMTSATGDPERTLDGEDVDAEEGALVVQPRGRVHVWPATPLRPAPRALWLHPADAPPPRELVVVASRLSRPDRHDLACVDLAAWLSRRGGVRWARVTDSRSALSDGQALEPDPGVPSSSRALLVPWRSRNDTGARPWWASWQGPVILCRGGAASGAPASLVAPPLGGGALLRAVRVAS